MGGEKMKRMLAFLLCLCLTFSFGMQAFSVGAAGGLEALRAQFSRDRGPEKNGYAIDYSFFSPKTEENDDTAFPLVIIMAGAREGEYEGKELLANDYAMWSSEEYQRRFLASGGGYLLIARAPEEKLLYWDSQTLVEPLKAAIDDFITRHKKVDTNRIILIGWCIGAKGVVNQVCAYPDFYSAAVMMVPNFALSQAQAEKMKNIPVWLHGCKRDSYADYNLYIKPTWSRLVSAATDKSKRLFTLYDEAVDTTYFFNHNVWLQGSYDMHYDGPGYKGMKTVDGNGNEVGTQNGMITWLSMWNMPLKSPILAVSDDCTCGCHSQNIFQRLIWKVFMNVCQLFSLKTLRDCRCGEKHW